MIFVLLLCFPLKKAKFAGKKARTTVSIFILLYMEEQRPFLQSLATVTLESLSECCFRNYKEDNKIRTRKLALKNASISTDVSNDVSTDVSTDTRPSIGRYSVEYLVNKLLSGLLVCWLIMSLAERLSSKFHICPRSFASRPNIHFSDNLSAADKISRHTSCPKGFIY